MKFRACALLLFAVPLGLTSPAAASTKQLSLQQQIEARYQNKIVFLRGRYMARRLVFTPVGVLQGKSQTGPLWLSGVAIQHFHFEHHDLVITGTRMSFAKTDSHPPTMGAWASMDEVKIKIEESPQGLESLNPALRKIFALTLGDALRGDSPTERAKATRAIPVIPAAPKPGTKRPKSPVLPAAFGGETFAVPIRTPGAATIHPHPNLKVSGTCTVDMTIDLDGRPTHVHVTHKSGKCTPSLALAIVAGYRYWPATYFGKPMTQHVEMLIQIHTDPHKSNPGNKQKFKPGIHPKP